MTHESAISSRRRSWGKKNILVFFKNLKQMFLSAKLFFSIFLLKKFCESCTRLEEEFEKLHFVSVPPISVLVLPMNYLVLYIKFKANEISLKDSVMRVLIELPSSGFFVLQTFITDLVWSDILNYFNPIKPGLFRIHIGSLGVGFIFARGPWYKQEIWCCGSASWELLKKDTNYLSGSLNFADVSIFCVKIAIINTILKGP